jgi:DNA-binding NarL/FixJ family response regulator
MIRLLIADDQAIVRAGVAVIAGAEPDITVVGEASDGAEAVRMARELRPDVICMDIRMPNMDGIEATRQITADPRLTAEVLVVTTFDIDDDVFAALEAGAAGFLLKGAEESTLLGSIRSIAAGGGTLDQRLTRRVLRPHGARARRALPPR